MIQWPFIQEGPMLSSAPCGNGALLTPSLLARAATLHTEFARACAVSRDLIARGRDRRLSSTYSGLRPIAGGSDAGLVALAITGAALCLPCVAKKTGVPAADAEAMLLRIASTLELTAGPGRCDSCLEQASTFRLDRAAEGVDGHVPAAAHPGENIAVVVWRYLEAHRGQMFCTQCVARALGMVRRIDRAIIAAEGRGARRRYGACQACLKERLVCGL
jgi:hypothetical protein